MVKRDIYKLKNQAKVIALARAYDSKVNELVRLVMLAAAAGAGLLYFFSYFFSFSFTLERVLTED